jgi:Restriction endonuclease
MTADIASRLIDMTEIPPDGEEWELFTQDFLRELGFYIESQPDRGADGGKDLIVTEDLIGTLNRYKFRWLVSCKHFATRGKSVSESDEPSIQERMSTFRAQGFIGFYSTVPSSGLNNRMYALKAGGHIEDFRFFDSRLIENYLVRLGYSKILMRYLPQSYKRVKPLHLIFSEYLPLKCGHCAKDLLETVHENAYDGLVGIVSKFDEQLGKDVIYNVYWACKGNCDKLLQERYRGLHGAMAKWEDLSDLVIPFTYLNWVIVSMNEWHSGKVIYRDSAHAEHRQLLMALSQRVFREMTEDERKRAIENLHTL